MSIKSYYILIIFLIFIQTFGFGQAQTTPYCKDPKFEKTVASYISFTIPTLSVQQLKKMDKETILLDAREEVEFKTSHLPNAIHIGFDKWKEDVLNTIPKIKRSLFIVVLVIEVKK